MLAIACCALPLQCQTTPQTPAERGQAFLNEFARKHSLPGAVAGVGRAGEVPWIGTFGEADVEQHVPVRPETVFRIGSLSKLLTAEALVKLAGEGKLDLDADIRQYVPSFPPKEYPITARELAGHLAGIHHYGRNDYINTERIQSVAESLKRFMNDPLVQAPRTKYLYSSFGYVLLGAVVEGASGQNYTGYLENEVLKPLGMSRTVPDFNDMLVKWRARPYTRGSDGALKNGPYMDTSDRLPAGGYASTVNDLLKFGLAHVGPQAAAADSYRLLFSPQKTSSGQETHVGFSWRIGKDSKGRTIYHHGGDTVGGRGFLLIYPEERMVVVFLSNLSFAPFNEKDAEALADCFR